MENGDIGSYLAAHPFLAGLPAAHVKTLEPFASFARFEPDEYLFRLGDPADRFYLIRHGRVSIEVATPHLGPITIQTLDDGDVAGWSWLFPPFEWNFDARAVLPTRALRLDGLHLRETCERDPRFGYEMMKRFSSVMHERLQATRMQLLDLYKAPLS